ncbi:chromosome segregation protein SMC [Limosilactobacillus mucosae]|uniref:chromosome segregation protein SMC n=1 Tax=Limosilactobacillus mucosae TaxID=97478 RepID=UPI0039968E3B
MRLLSLTLDGFKSFAQPTTIEFRPGMTGIIGPNGSGKSNIIEAIRWVLGEQSAKTLRGNKMADVIFNGSEDRAPLNRALVSIAFDNSDHYLNSDFSELKITRKLYRNGDSEYLINNQQVRLRDIVDLFVDSGVGRESFSVISQGRIAEIFNGKPADRRAIIETAAGVSKYKQNKATAEKRLDTTRENLNRVNDIVAELEDQLEPLAEQSALAQDYLEQKGKFDLLDKTRTVRELDSNQATLKQVIAKQEKAQTMAAEYDEQAKAAAQTLSQQQAQQKRLLTVKDELQQKILDATTIIGKLNSKQSLSSVRLEQRENEKQRLLARKNELKQQLAATEQALLQQDKTIADQQQAIKEHQKALNEAKSQSAEQRAQQLAQKLESMRDQQVDLMQKQAAAHNQQTFLQRSHEQALNQYQQHSDELKNVQERLRNAQQNADQQAQLVIAAQKEQQAKTQQLDQEKAQQAQLQTQYEHVQQSWYQALGDVRSCKNRVKNYQAMAADYTGYYSGVQNVLKQRRQFNGLYGPVSELIKVPQAYTTALETVLGGQLQHLVVATQNDGKQIINYLVRQRGGRATILPLDTLRGGYQPRNLERLRTLPGFVGRASELIQYDPRFQVVIDHLLSNTIVADNLDHATLIAKEGQHQVRVITLDGQLINTSGAMTGGASRSQRIGLLSQQQMVEKMKQELQVQQQRSSELEQKVAQLEQARQSNQQTLAVLQNETAQANQKLSEAKANQQLADSQLAELKRQLKALDYQANAAGNPDQFAQEMAAAKQNEQQLFDELTQLKAAMEKTKQQQNDLQNNASAQLEQLHEMQQWLAVARERLRQAKEQRTELQTRQDDTNEHLTSLQQQLQLLDHDDQQQADDRQTTAAALAEAQQQLHDAQNQLKSSDEKLTTLNDQLQDANEQNDRLQALQRAAIEDLSGIKSQRARLEMLIDQGLNRLSETYSMTLADARQELSPLPDDELNRQLKLLKRGLDELGPVNTGAIQEYERISERYDFLSGQKADLEKARDQLKETMDAMDEQVKTRFIKTFKEVSAAFTETFATIFEGGQAKLVLTDPDDVLASGVDIMAQPPGKRNQQLSLLSGGEKALTAIALLFAILKVRPVPFAILDEPEAALDEVNVDRFAKYLSRFGEDGPQFIVITHRKGTMMNANVLYGVTMQESGVSKMVSVDVEEALNSDDRN